MFLVRPVLLSFLLALPFLANAQKVKYKDIYVWLANKQYTEAEPFLRRYLKENDDNPNAFLYMGIILEQNAQKNDVLKEGARSLANMDSSKMFFDKALAFMTEKELKRNDEYYESFKRRDLRTGEYGVKLSDIQFFIEKQLQGLRERSDKIKLVNFYFALTDSTYRHSQRRYMTLRQQYPSKKSMLLRADYTTVQQLEGLSDSFDSCAKAFDIFKTNLLNLGKTQYDYTLTLLPIEELAHDGMGAVDFLNDDVKLWDYQKFAEQSIKIIKDDIAPLRDHLVSADIDINRLREKVIKDSIPVHLEVAKLKSKLQHENLLAYDEKPLPTVLINLKMAEINYLSDLVEHHALKDSLNIPLKLSLAKEELVSIAVLDSLAKDMLPMLVDEKMKDYEHFIRNTYSQASVLKSYVSGLQEFAARQREFKQFEVSFRTKGVNHLLLGPDSVALYLNPGPKALHQPLVILPEKYTAGLYFKTASDTLAQLGYFYAITPSRIPDIKVTFPVDTVYRRHTLGSTKALIITEATDQIFFVITYHEQSIQDKIPVTIAKIYRSDGLAWSNHFRLDIIPLSAIFVNGELIVTGADDRKWVIDKNGKLK